MPAGRRNLKNNWSTTLQADAAAADVTLSLPQPMLDLLVSPVPSADEWYMLTLDDGVQAPEIVRCTGKGSGTATVVRAQEGTAAPTTWATGTVVEIRATAELLRVLEGAQYDAANQTLVIGANGAGRSISGAFGGVLIGPGAGYELTSGDYNVVLGAGALGTETTGHRNTACGYQALGYIDGGSLENTGLGYAAGSSGGSAAAKNTYIGAYADNAYGVGALTGVLCLGHGALAHTSNVASIGSEGARLSEVYIGGGQRDQAAAQVTLSASAGSGTNKNGGDLRLGGGKPTGSGTPGKVIIATAAGGGASGSTETAWTDRAEWDSTGLFWTYAGLKTGNPAAGAGTWKLGTVQAGAVALDTANYVEVDIGGTLVKLLKAA